MNFFHICAKPSNYTFCSLSHSCIFHVILSLLSLPILAAGREEPPAAATAGGSFCAHMALTSFLVYTMQNRNPRFLIYIFYFTFTNLTAIYGLDGMSIVNSPLWRPAGVMVMFQVSMTSTSNSCPSGMWNGRRHGRLAP